MSAKTVGRRCQFFYRRARCAPKDLAESIPATLPKFYRPANRHKINNLVESIAATLPKFLNEGRTAPTHSNTLENRSPGPVTLSIHQRRLWQKGAPRNRLALLRFISNYSLAFPLFIHFSFQAGGIHYLSVFMSGHNPLLSQLFIFNPFPFLFFIISIFLFSVYSISQSTARLSC